MNPMMTTMFDPVPPQRGSEQPPRRTEEVAPAPALSAVERYKEIIAIATDAAARQRKLDEVRCAELAQRIAATQQRIAEVSDRERVVRMGAHLHWESAVEQLWNERWLQMVPFPKADESVPPRPQGEYLKAMDVAYQALEDSLAKRTLLRRKQKD
ncbi:hypothetical protein SAMN05216553_114249 [Lentzea fradiae]|uniref:Uncharacterized protein n=1 Tax=Lentzea fradiae TaxID=200378 RepID=A0A1G7Z1D6_9PSEU|nr:hypothetical protein [Lentzea fradiae]SDH01970.1 hypothetical protein SAMN05216553_114249 [Lentzea fradiae]